MIICEFSLVGSCKRGLESETVGNALLLPDDHSGRGFLGLLDSEVAIGEVEYVAVLVEQAGEYLLLQPVIDLPRVAIHKHVLLTRVPVNVAEQENVTVLLQFFNHLQIIA